MTLVCSPCLTPRLLNPMIMSLQHRTEAIEQKINPSCDTIKVALSLLIPNPMIAQVRSRGSSINLLICPSDALFCLRWDQIFKKRSRSSHYSLSSSLGNVFSKF